jgi:serine protease Do
MIPGGKGSLKEVMSWKFYCVILVLSLALTLGCTVSKGTREQQDKVLVEDNAPVFDKRFKELSYEDLDLSRLWEEGTHVTDTPVPIHNLTIADLTESVKRGVVNLYTLKLEEKNVQFGFSPNKLLPFNIPLFSDVLEVIPFRVPIPYQDEGFSLGTGFIINREGYILTNAHVVHNATDIMVVLSEARIPFPAKIIGADPVTDTALLKMPPVGLSTILPLADSDRLRTGEMVIAIGNPLGLRHTVTLGIVSAKDRIAPGSGKEPMEFIQTDSAINPGNSGGPLLNLRGEVVGINTAIVAKAQSIGFAIPINTVKEVMPLLVLGKKERGWFGAKVAPLGPKDALRLKYPGEFGIIIKEVEDKSPAKEAGMVRDDIIMKMNGETLSNFMIFRRRLLGMLPGMRVSFTVFRDGEEISMTSTLSRRPE